jgi:vacuolar-type H+-ATPase subunit E/Vma4
MALAELLRSLQEEADARERTLLAEARAGAERLRTDRAADLARRVAAGRDAREVELRRAAARELEAARRRATGQLLEARAEALERIRRRAEARLAERAADPAGLPRLARDLALALEYLGTGPAIVEAPAPLLGGLRGTGSDPSRVTFVPSSDGRRGLVVRSADGRVTVDASIEHQITRAWPRLAIELAARLEALP